MGIFYFYFRSYCHSTFHIYVRLGINVDGYLMKQSGMLCGEFPIIAMKCVTLLSSVTEMPFLALNSRGQTSFECINLEKMNATLKQNHGQSISNEEHMR